MAYNKKSKKPKNDDTKHLAYIEELKGFQESDLDQREQARESDRFLLDKDGQWEEGIRQQLDSEKRPRYTFDKITPVIDTMMADIEEMDFGCNVKPDGGGAHKDLAETYEGMIRTIQNMSGSEEIFRNTTRRLMRRGFDAWIVKSKYRDEWSFEQDLFIEQVPNAINRVWTSNTSSKPDSSDSDVAYVLSALSPEKYKAQFPEGNAVSVDDADIGENLDEYRPEVIVIAERYYQKESPTEVAQLSNGDVVEVNEEYEKTIDERAQQGITTVKTKKVKGFHWYHCTFDGGGMLTDEAQTAFKTNPVVTVYGNYELLGQNSKITYSGLTLKEMDAQRVHNYAKSREIEEGALSPRRKLLMTKKQAKGHGDQIARMNISSDPVQFINPDEMMPQGVQEVGGPQINPHLSMLGNQMAADIKEQANVFSGMQGDFSGRQSEDAVRMQIDRGTAATRKWVNATINGVKRVCEILVQTIPVTYDTKRQFVITGLDGTESEVILNEEVYDQQTGQLVKTNNLNAGKYRVVCEAGPAFSNRLEAGLSALLEYAAIDPTVVAQGGDIMLKAIDAPLVDKIAERKRAAMLQQGVIPVEQMTDEEKKKMLEQAQKPKQPDANSMLAQAEMAKGQADMIQAQTKQAMAQHQIMNEQQKRQIDEFKALTDRMSVQVEAAEAGATIDNKQVDTTGKRLDNLGKTKTLSSPEMPQ